MLEVLVWWFVQQPIHILLIAGINLALWLAFRATVLRNTPHANVFWVSALVWLTYAGWEWLVLVKSPDSNIRVDLMLIWPVVAIVTLWAFVRAGKSWWSRG